MKMWSLGVFLMAGLMHASTSVEAAIAVEPANPTTADAIRLSVSGEYSNPCFELESHSTVRENDIDVFVRIIPQGGICATVITPWVATHELGRLPAGHYGVTATIDATCCPPCASPPCLEHSSFEVSNDVAVDIKPGDSPNSINPHSRGVIPVAILGNDTFDVADIDVKTIAFGTDAAPATHNLEYSFTYDAHLQDVNLDGMTDLVVHFRNSETGIVCGDESTTLTGATVPIPVGGFAPSNPSPSANTVSLDGDAIGDIVSLDVLVAGTADVYGAAFDLAYDPTKAEFAGWSEGELLESDGHPVAYLLNADEAGRVIVGTSRLGPVPGVDVGVTAKLVTLDLRVTDVGTSQVGFENAYLFNSQAGVIGGITFDGGTLLSQTASTLFEGTDSIHTVGCRGGRRSLFDRPGEDRLIQSRGGDATTPQRK